jgi:hypothetical protein
MTTLLESETLDGKALIWRAEKLLHLAEKIALEAKDAGDARLCLIALDRAQKSLDTLLRVSGLLRPDTLVLDNRTVNVFASWSTPDLMALDGLKQALEAGTVTAAQFESWLSVQSKTPQLPPGRSDQGEAA